MTVRASMALLAPNVSSSEAGLMAAARVLLNDAMTGVVGAFRKVSPFFSTTAIVPGL